MPEATRKRSVSLLKGRLLTVLKGTEKSNGHEALRMLFLQCQPSSRNRSLAILNVLMRWPGFDMKSSLLAQVVKLEEGFREYGKIAQQPLATELKFAVLLRCISGQLRTPINVSIKEDSSYEELREMILQYDRATIRWTGLAPLRQMVLFLWKLIGSLRKESMTRKGKAKTKASLIGAMRKEKEKERTRETKEKESTEESKVASKEESRRTKERAKEFQTKPPRRERVSLVDVLGT